MKTAVKSHKDKRTQIHAHSDSVRELVNCGITGQLYERPSCFGIALLSKNNTLHLLLLVRLMNKKEGNYF